MKRSILKKQFKLRYVVTLLGILICISFPDSSLALYQGKSTNQGKTWPGKLENGIMVYEIPVCFRTPEFCPPNPDSICCTRTYGTIGYGIETSEDVWDPYKQKIKEVLESSWSTWTNIRFTGFYDCERDSISCESNYLPGYIYVDLLKPYQHAIKNFNTIPKPTVFDFRMNFAGGSSDPHGFKPDSGTKMWIIATRDDRIFTNVIIHEFGHALGLIHELKRPEARPNGECICPEYDTKQQCTCVDGFALTTYYDPYSIMNYCAPKGFRLTAGDILGIQYLYGASITENWRKSMPAITLNCL